MSTRTPMIFVFGAWLESKKTELNLPAIRTDMLAEDGVCLAISQSASPITEKEYINGSKLCRMNLDIIAQGSQEDRPDLLQNLSTLCFLFDNMSDVDLDANHKILRASSTAPTLKQQTENGMIQYVIAVSLIYKEK